MPNDTLTTKHLTTRQLARLWHVSEATIKRWADAGHLSSVKTVGGHRRFAPEDVARFQQERGLGGGGGAASAARDHSAGLTAGSRRDARGLTDADTEHFFAALAEGRESEAGALLINLYLGGAPLAEILDVVVGGSLRRVGELWHGGQMTVADEHLATRTAISALASLRRAVAPPAQGTNGGGPLAVCCAVESELHEVPTLCAQVLLEAGGWRVVNLGANTPLYALADAVAKHRPGLVCISSTTNLSLDRSARDYTN
ncbi:MAG: helix-turn-helix domain-containing protein, partial [Pyrinomonadaceae bacterium]